MERKGATVTLHLPIRQVVNEEAMRLFARYKAEWLADDVR